MACRPGTKRARPVIRHHIYSLRPFHFLPCQAFPFVQHVVQQIINRLSRASGMFSESV
jgi:hypothetical protein